MTEKELIFAISELEVLENFYKKLKDRYKQELEELRK